MTARMARGAAVWFWEGEPGLPTSKKHVGTVVGTWSWASEPSLGRTRSMEWGKDPRQAGGAQGYLVRPAGGASELVFLFFGDVVLGTLGPR